MLAIQRKAPTEINVYGCYEQTFEINSTLDSIIIIMIIAYCI